MSVESHKWIICELILPLIAIACKVGIGSGLFLKFHVLYQVACPSTSWFIYPMNFFDTSTKRPTPTYVHQLRQQIAAPQLVIGLLTIPYCTPNYILNIPSYLPAINIASIAMVDSSRSIGYISGSYYGWLVVWNIFYFSICCIGNSQLANIFQRGWNHQQDGDCIQLITHLSPLISPW